MSARASSLDAEIASRTPATRGIRVDLTHAPRTDVGALLEALPNAHLLLDHGRTIVYANAAARERLGVEPTGAQWERRASAAEKALPDGTLVTLDAANRDAASLSRAQAALAHQIRSPLTAAGLTVEQLLANTEDADEQARLERVRQSLVSIEQHLRNALVFVHGELAERQSFTARELARAMRDAWVHLLPAGHGDWFESFDADDRLSGDKAALVSALTNVVENARAVAGARARIDVSLESDAQTLAITIVDDGPGIERALLERLRARMRGRDAQPLVSSRAGGTGLGLPIADAVVRAHGGVIEIESAVGRGTRVCVVLPLAQRRRVARDVAPQVGAGA